MRTPHACTALVVALLLTPAALAVGTMYALPVLLMFFPFLLLFGSVVMLALARPGVGRIDDLQVAVMPQASHGWIGSYDLPLGVEVELVVYGELGVDGQPALRTSLHQALADGEVSLHDFDAVNARSPAVRCGPTPRVGAHLMQRAANGRGRGR